MRTVLLSGGVGGAKLARGFQQVLDRGRLWVVANTADDVELHGLHISPDLDTLLYTLAGVVDAENGWGLAGDSFHVLEALGELGEPTWFRLGDRDLATHLLRSRLLGEGWRLTEVSLFLAERFRVAAVLLPMCDERVETVIHTPDGPLAFQEYFVRERCRPRVERLEFRGAGTARLTPEVEAALAAAELIVIAPSNPYLSVDPILAVPGLRAALQASAAPLLAVSPIVGGRALKGPAAKIMAELGHEASCLTVAQHYRGLADGLVIDEADAGLASRIEGMAVWAVPTVMTTDGDKAALAGRLLELAAESLRAA